MITCGTPSGKVCAHHTSSHLPHSSINGKEQTLQSAERWESAEVEVVPATAGAICSVLLCLCSGQRGKVLAGMGDKLRPCQ